MSISLSVSSVLLPKHNLVACTYRSHGAIVESLGQIAEAASSPLCKSVAYVGDFYGDLDLIELPDSALRRLHADLRVELDDCDPVVDAIRETIDARRQFRSSLPAHTLLCALLRDRIRTELEFDCGGKLYASSVYKWASQRGAIEDLRWLIKDMFQPFNRWKDCPNRDLIIRGCVNADRIA